MDQENKSIKGNVYDRKSLYGYRSLYNDTDCFESISNKKYDCVRVQIFYSLGLAAKYYLGDVATTLRLSSLRESKPLSTSHKWRLLKIGLLS